MQKSLTRREASELILAAASSMFLPFLKGCGSIVGGSEKIQNIKDPDQILNNQRMQNLISIVEEEGYSLNLSRALNPPYIVGNYEMSGERIYPSRSMIAPGTFRWRNQTSNNHIETDYSQLGIQTGESRYGEIIRGEDNIFTVYSRLNFNNANGCGGVADIVVDGAKFGNGDVNAIYIGRTISLDIGCVTTENEVAGFLELNLASNPKRNLRERQFEVLSPLIT